MIGRRLEEPPLGVLERMRQPIPTDSRSDASERRKAAITGITAALRSEKARRSSRRPLLVAAAAAAALLVAGAASHHFLRAEPQRARAAETAAELAPVEVRVSSGIAVATRHGVSSAVLADGVVRIARGDAVRTGPDAAATLLLPRGVRVELRRATKVSIEQAEEFDQRLSLDIGETAVSVPRPGGPKTFSVRTPDARVVVHGTEFTVLVEEVGAAHTTRTSVSVTRGLVGVTDARGEHMLKPGESWTTGGESEAAAPSVERSPAEAASARARGGAAPIATGSLGEQNRLFQAALDARQSGDNTAAVRAIDELFARFPATTLAQEAHLTRFRALKALHRSTEALHEARRYLAAHPDAPAADEARRALLESTTGDDSKEP